MEQGKTSFKIDLAVPMSFRQQVTDQCDWHARESIASVLRDYPSHTLREHHYNQLLDDLD